MIAPGTDRRTPTPGEQREIDSAEGLERGRLMYKYGGDRRRDLITAEVVDIVTGDVSIFCPKCQVTYRPADYCARLGDAAEGGKDLWLTTADQPRPGTRRAND